MSQPTGEAPENGIPENGTPTRKAKLYPLGALLSDFRADADAANQARVSGIPRGPITGLTSIDRELSGALAPGIHFMHGNAGTGKTAFGLQTAATCAFPAMFVTCEMSPVELLRRHTARVTGTYLGRLKSGEMRGEEAESLARRAIEAALALAFVDATQGPAALQFLHDSALIVKRDADHILIVIDSLHSWTESAHPVQPEYEALNSGIADLQRLASALKCPVLIISERNRDSMKSGGINAGAGTRKIEYSAETIIDLERKPDAKEDGAGEVEVLLKLAKNRHGTANKPIRLSFNGALQRFSEAK
jgi:replicative DNA helicase